MCALECLAPTIYKQGSILKQHENENLRLNKYLQRYAGLSRRQADRFIEQGKVKIDGKTAALGTIVAVGRQEVKLERKVIKSIKKIPRYIVMNKPVGYICSREGYRTVFELLPEKFKSLSYVGRLDVNTSGALLFTDDGEFTEKILRSNISRIYLVELNHPLNSDAEKILRRGPMLDSRPARVGRVEKFQNQVRLELFEGRSHEVRRIFQVLGYEIENLHREKFGPVDVDNLEIGKVRLLKKNELKALMKFISQIK